MAKKEVIKVKMRVDKLRTQLALLQPVVPKKTALPIVKHVLLKDGNILATNLETAVSISFPEADGECLLPYHSIMELLKHVPGDDMLTIEPDGKKIKLSLRGGTATYDTGDPKDYPPVPEVVAKAEADLDGDLLVETLVSVLPYCSTETARPVLCGIALYLGKTIEVAAADGFRLAFQSLPLSYPVQETIIIPANTVSILEHIWKKAPGTVALGNSLVQQLTGKRQLKVTLGEGNGRIKLQFGDITLVSTLISGTPPRHKDLIPNFQELTKVKFFATELLNAVKRLEEIAKDGAGIVRLSWTDTVMTVFAKSEEKGDSMAEIPLQPGSSPGRIALSINNILDYLSGKPGLIAMGVTTEQSPAVFHYGNSPVVVVMPMMVQWGDEPNKEEETTQTEEEATVEREEPPTGELAEAVSGEEE